MFKDELEYNTIPEWDSVAHMTLIAALEEAFDIKIPFNANDPSHSEFNISSVSSIISGIEKLVAEKS